MPPLAMSVKKGESLTWGDYLSYRARAEAAEAERDRLKEALETICEIGETRDVIVARAALAAQEEER